MSISSNPRTRELSWQDKNILCTIIPPADTRRGIVEYLLNFGNLYYGTCNKLYYLQQYQSRLTFLQNLAKKINLTDQDKQNLGFNLFMLRKAILANWRLPGLIHNNSVNRGNSRLWATGMCKPSPWTHLNFIEFQNHNQDNLTTDNPIKITTTKQLHEILDIEYLDQPAADVEFILEEYVDNGSIRLKINGMYFKEDPDDRSHDTVGNEHLEQFLTWMHTYSGKPTIKIYTDWPELVSDSSDIWDIEIAGSITDIKKTIVLPGHIERQIRQLHNAKTNLESHTMHIINPVKIDLGELLFWMDVAHTTYIDSNYNYILYRRDTEYKTTFVSTFNNK
jgi:hypothetical protein